MIDPLGGSHYVEHLTSEYERRIFAVLDEIEEGGGTIQRIEEGWFQRHIAEFSHKTAVRKASGELPVIGVNKYVEEEECMDIEVHPYDASSARRQIDRLKRVRAERDEAQVQQLLSRLKEVAKDESENMLPGTIELLKAGASMGDIVEALKELWGGYRETPVF